MKPQNLLIILSDEHNPDVLGCAGHPEVLTPNLDKLARRGTRFLNATCASPICVPARAALATGRNIFETGYWDNADAYDGKTPSWHHLVRSEGHEVVAIGKLHYRGKVDDDYGFSQTILPMHLHEGKGELKMLLRTVRASDGAKFLGSAKAGRSAYNDYDENITAQAEAWLRSHAVKQEDAKPWVLLVSLVAPHFPLTVPEEFFNLYRDRPLALPKDYHFGLNRDGHPYVAQYGNTTPYNLHFKTEEDVRRALSGYYGLVSYLDNMVGRILSTLRESGLEDTTRVMYTSDHGENAGARGLWGKSTMYRESVGVPMIIAGSDVAAGSEVQTAVNHIDVYNSVLDAVGISSELSTASPRSESIFRSLESDREVLSEYHAIGSRSAIFMLQNSAYKYVHYCDAEFDDEFFDLNRDPEERVNLVNDATVSRLVSTWRHRLESIVDSHAADREAKARQAELVAQYGGRDAILQRSGIGGFSPPPNPRH